MAHLTTTERRRARVRRSLKAVSRNRLRLSVFRSSKHIYAQVIDDEAGRTLAAASDVEESLRGQAGTKLQRAQQVGQLLAQRAKDRGLGSVVFDRGGFAYAGRVRALADAAREEGLVF